MLLFKITTINIEILEQIMSQTRLFVSHGTALNFPTAEVILTELSHVTFCHIKRFFVMLLPSFEFCVLMYQLAKCSIFLDKFGIICVNWRIEPINGLKAT